MKKKLLVAMITACLIVGGIAIVYNQYPNSDSNLVEETLISKEDFERMSKIIADVNAGKLPIDALEDAKPLIKKRPDMLSKKIADQINTQK